MTALASRIAPTFDTLHDVLDRLGDVPARRVLMHPPPGTATLNDLIRANEHEGRCCELVDGALVEKAVGFRESMLASALNRHLGNFVAPRNLGIVTGEQGFVQLSAGLVRGPDVAYLSWARVPGGRVPAEPVPALAPNFAVEILSPSNTVREMERKRQEYFSSGVKLVWIIDPELRTAEVYTSPTSFKAFDESGTLDGGSVLPGFSLSLRDLFAELDRQASR